MSRAIFIASLLFHGILLANLPEDPVEYSRWESTMLEAIQKQRSLPPVQAIPKLSNWILQVSNPNTPNWEKGDRPVFHAVQSALLAIPGHAEYYRDKINEERAKMDAIHPEENISMWTYQRTQWQDAKTGFAVMAHLPSVETMRVLGEFIKDDRGKKPLPPPKAGYDQNLAWYSSRPHSYNAVVALNSLPLVSKPFQGTGYRKSISNSELDDAVKSWNEWFQEIKDGKRTFRFEGNPTEYDLNGPAPKEKLERIALNRRMENDRAARHGGIAANAGEAAQPSSAGEPPRKPLPYALIAAALAVLVSMVWYFRRAKNR